MLLKNEWVMNEMKEEILSNKWKWEHNNPKSVGYSESSSKGEIHSNTGLPQETRKISNKQSNIIFKGTRKRITKSKVSRRKEIIKIRAEINEIQS